ncbi:unnamed protein product, partial [Cladocopium goreaui]
AVSYLADRPPAGALLLKAVSTAGVALDSAATVPMSQEQSMETLLMWATTAKVPSRLSVRRFVFGATSRGASKTWQAQYWVNLEDVLKG